MLTPERMIPGDEYVVAVTVTNTTARVLPKADYLLSYRWTLPDGTDYTRSSNRAETALPGDLTPGQSVTVNATVKAPIRTDLGNQRESFILNWDLLNHRNGRWLSESDGVAPLSQNVTADFLNDLALMFNSIVQGWINYYGRFYKVHVVSPPTAHQRASGALGHAEVQTVAPTREAGGRATGGSLTAIPKTVRPLAFRPQTCWLDDGSRVSREVKHGSASGGGCDSPRRLSRWSTA